MERASQRHRGPRATLKWAQRTTGATVPDVAHLCTVLCLDLSGALERARGKQ